MSFKLPRAVQTSPDHAWKVWQRTDYRHKASTFKGTMLPKESPSSIIHVAREETVESFIAFVCEKRLHVPVLMLLEVARPFTTFWKVGGLLAEPFGQILFGRKLIDRIAEIASDGDAVERIMHRIEQDAAKTA